MKKKEFLNYLVQHYKIAMELKEDAWDKFYNLSLADRETLKAVEEKNWHVGYNSGQINAMCNIAQILGLKEELKARLKKECDVEWI